jgi:Zn-dependent oligopeptidase/isoaspartyl peptidase/L-asparaginase-like protein (Ntn-hydrolase superfamily)
LAILHAGLGPKDSIGHRRLRPPHLLKAISEIAQNLQGLMKTGAHSQELSLHGIRQLEACPFFNAGIGAKLQRDGRARLSASLMRGRDLRFSSVSNLESVAHASAVAELLLDESDRNMSGIFATELAMERGLSFKKPETPAREEEWTRQLEGQTGTVGCVAVDIDQHCFAATSTGGRGFERPGRISDSCSPAGNYAGPSGAISCTGVGEQILEAGVATAIHVRLEDGHDLASAVQKSFAPHRDKKFGVIALDRQGHGLVHATTGTLLFACVTLKQVWCGITSTDWQKIKVLALALTCLLTHAPLLNSQSMPEPLPMRSWQEVEKELRGHFSFELPKIPKTPTEVVEFTSQLLESWSKDIEELKTITETSAFLRAIDSLHSQSIRADGVLSVASVVLGDKKLRKSVDKESLRVYEFWIEQYYSNPELFRRLQHLEIDRDQLSKEEASFLKHEIENFRFYHTELDDENDPDETRETQQKISNLWKTLERLEIEYERNIEESSRSISFSLQELDGLPVDFLSTLRRKGEKYVIESQHWYQYDKVMRYAHRSNTRKKVFQARFSLAAEVNLELLQNILEIRERIADYHDSPDFVSWKIEQSFFETRQDLERFLSSLEKANRTAFQEEKNILQKQRARRNKKGDLKIRAWDWLYEINQYQRKTLGDLAPRLEKAFELDQTLAALLRYGGRFGFQTEQIKDYPAWHPSVRAFMLRDTKTKKALGIILLDPFPRPDKDRWFFSMSLQARDAAPGKLPSLPINLISANFSPPDSDGKSFLSTEGDGPTLAHELGHAMHDLLTEVSFSTISGFRAVDDMTEMPSNFYERRFFDPEFLKLAAVDPETAKPFSEPEIEQLRAAMVFGSAHLKQEQILRARLDFELHKKIKRRKSRSKGSLGAMLNSPDVIESKLSKKLFYALPPDTYPVASFSHIGGGGYEALFWIYLFGAVMSHEFESLFFRSDDRSLSPHVALRYREKVLGVGGTQTASKIAESFLGREMNACSAALRFMKNR